MTEDNKDKSEDNTVAPDKKLPYTGKSVVIAILSSVILGIGYICYKKYKYLNIK